MHPLLMVVDAEPGEMAPLSQPPVEVLRQSPLEQVLNQILMQHSKL
jgi:hypothetical protein